MLPAALLAFALAGPAAFAGAGAVAAGAAPEVVRPRLDVQMRVEPEVEMSPADLLAIAQEVARIWSPVLDVHVATPAELARVRAVDRVTLTVTNRLLPGGERTGLGWIEFVNGEPQSAMTVSVAAAGRLLEGGQWRGRRLDTLPRLVARVFVQRALARAAAHEIGHYLLRSTAHDRKGLMRPVFSIDEIMDERASLVRLSASEIARLRTNEAVFARKGE